MRPDLRGGTMDPMGMSGLLSDLNAEQQRAVEHGDGPLLILAGAGTGKTRTITRRVAHLVRDQGVPAGRVLAITFTNKAAGEMRQRISRIVPHTGMWVGTFHATCARMLRMDPEPIGRTRDFSIIDVDDRRRLLRQLIKEEGWDPQVFRPRVFEAMISLWKQRRWTPEVAEEHALMRNLDEQRCAIVYGKYEQAMARQDGLDFDDLLWKGLQLVEHDAKGEGRWAARFAHVVVDEFQDTNEVQYELVKRLASDRNLAVCGDPDQSIYRWRGADIGNILRFDSDFPDAEVVRLERNYRSVGNVLAAAQEVIRNNTSRKEKDLRTEREDGPPLGLIHGLDEEIEADLVAQRAAGWIADGTSPREVAVFYRTNACSRSLEAAFTRLQVPYQVVGGLSFFERREIKDLVSYARLALNPRDDSACTRILNVPARGIGQTTVGRLQAFAAEHDEPLLQVLEREEVRSAIRGPGRKGVLGFLKLMEDLREDLAAAAPALRRILERTGYRRYAEAMEATEDVDRGENIDELIAFAEEYDAREDGGLRGFLEEISLLTDIDRWAEEAERISLMTVHAAKGLEFDRVAVVGLEEGLFPHARSFEEDEGLEEERRLFYVALTRAREELLLSFARRRFRTGAPGPTEASRFLRELPEELVDGELPGQGLRMPEWRRRVGASNTPVEKTPELDLVDREFADGPSPEDFLDEAPTAVPAGVAPETDAAGAELETAAGDDLPFAEGEAVEHPVFGPGTVSRIQGHGANARVVVAFERGGAERVLLLAYSMLRKVD